MVQTVYTSARHVDVKSCDRPIYLEKLNFFNEFRSEVEKALARRNLGIYGGEDLTWENIKGLVSLSQALVEYLKLQFNYNNSSFNEISTILSALDLSLSYIKDYIECKKDFSLVSLEVTLIKESIQNLYKDLQTLEGSILNSVSLQCLNIRTEVNTSIASLSGDITKINTSVSNILKDVADLNTRIGDVVKVYVTTDYLSSNYVSSKLLQELIDTNNTNSFISNLLKQYYTVSEINNKFVTKDWLTGSASGTDYVFVTTNLYNTDKEDILKQLDSTLKTEKDGSVKALTVETVKSSREKLNIQTSELQINSLKVALTSEVPVIETLERSEYEERLRLGNLKDDVYYCTYSDELSDGLITYDILKSECFLKAEVNDLILVSENKIKTLISDLVSRIELLETLNKVE